MTLSLVLLLACSEKFEAPVDTGDSGLRGAQSGDGAPGGGGNSGGGNSGGDSGSAGSDPLDSPFDVPALGDPVEAPLAGATWRAPFAEMDISDPPGGGLLFSTLFAQDALLFRVTWASASAFGLEVSVGLEGGQDPCTAPHELPTADFSGNPLFEIPEGAFEVSSGDPPVEVRRARMAGVLSSDGERWTWAALKGQLDSRDFQEDLDSAGLDLCELLSDLGTGCVACEDGVEVCVNLIIDDMPAELYTGAYDPDAGSGC